MPFHVRLLYLLLMGNVLLRTLTNGFGVLPKVFNVFDIPVVALLFLISLSQRGAGTPAAPWVQTISRRLLGFCVVLFLGCVLNPSYIYLPAATSQFVMLVEPLLLYVAIVHLPFTGEQIDGYARLLKKLIIFEVIVGVCQLPMRFKSGDSEAVHGTFPGNAEQYAAFLMVGVFYLIALAVLTPQRRKRYIAAIVVILLLTLSIDNKASWLGV